jgi:biotin carboxyl carrier protein
MGNAPNGVRPDRMASVEGAGPNGEALTLPLAIKPNGHGTTVGVDGKPGEPVVAIQRENGAVTWRIGSRTLKTAIVADPDEPGRFIVSAEGHTIAVTLAHASAAAVGAARAAVSGPMTVKAPIPGLVMRIDAPVGTAVAKGDALVTLHAMKLENTIRSPIAGVVAAITCTAGSAVDKGTPLARIEPASA